MKIARVWGLFTQELIYSATHLPFRQHRRAVLPHPNPPPSHRLFAGSPSSFITFITCSQHFLSNLQGTSAQLRVAHGEQPRFAPSSTQHPAAHPGTQLAVGFLSKLRALEMGCFFFPHFFFFFCIIKNKQQKRRDASCPVKGHPKSTSTNQTAPCFPNCGCGSEQPLGQPRPCTTRCSHSSGMISPLLLNPTHSFPCVAKAAFQLLKSDPREDATDIQESCKVM